MATAAMTTTQAYDVIVIGGSFAGLSAAMQLARARRRVCVVDAGQPRNRFAAASHGFFGQDGEPPLAMIEQARRKLAAYPTVGFVQGTVVSATAQQRAGSPENGFEVVLDDGTHMEAHKLVLAFGVQDGLPEIAGLRERWGASVLHCPYCHGYEFAGQRLGVLYHSAGSAMHAQLIADWGPTTLFLNGDTTLESADRERLLAQMRQRLRVDATLADLPSLIEGSKVELGTAATMLRAAGLLAKNAPSALVAKAAQRGR